MVVPRLGFCTVVIKFTHPVNMDIPGCPYSRDFGDPVVIIGTPFCRRLVRYGKAPTRCSSSRKYRHRGPHICVKMGIRDAHFQGCLFSLDTGVGMVVTSFGSTQGLVTSFGSNGSNFFVWKHPRRLTLLLGTVGSANSCRQH